MKKQGKCSGSEPDMRKTDSVKVKENTIWGMETMHDDAQAGKKRGYKIEVDSCGLGRGSVRLDKLKLCKQMLW